MTTKWNLVDFVSGDSEQRAFHLPLASVPRGVNVKFNQYIKLKNLFSFIEESEVPSGFPTLSVLINSPVSGQDFPSKDSAYPKLPFPAIRLHAMMRGRIRFLPASSSHKHRIELTSAVLSRGMPRWFALWKRAGCVPTKIIYENVDLQQLKVRLKTVPIGKSDYGLSFPIKVKTDQKKKDFIQYFLRGPILDDPKTSHYMEVEEGAYVGLAGRDPFPTNPGDPTRLLKLQVFYANHTISHPHPMNPRELFHLFFGVTSNEQEEHPLLLRLADIGKKQKRDRPGVILSKTYALRPPLRTFKRVEWEARAEIDRQVTRNAWRFSAGLSGRFYNHYKAHNVPGSNLNHLYPIPPGTRVEFCANCFKPPSPWVHYTGLDKCNLFVSEMCVRAGFRIPVVWDQAHTLRSWYYALAQNWRTVVQNVQSGSNACPIPLRGVQEASGTGCVWAWKVECQLQQKLASGGASAMVQFLNQAMHTEGRCFVVTNGVHVAIVHTAKKLNLSRRYIEGRFMEARGSVGASLTSQGKSTAMAAANLIEMEPGWDPDTFWGLRDLLVQVCHSTP